MDTRKSHHIWTEQCEAARTIKERYGVTAAFDYLVGEKLMTFAAAAADHPDFARELPRFVSEVRRMFTADVIGVHLAQIERAQNETDDDVVEDGDIVEEEDIFSRESCCRCGANPSFHAGQGAVDGQRAWNVVNDLRSVCPVVKIR